MTIALSKRSVGICMPTILLLSVSATMSASTILMENFNELTPGTTLTSAGVFTAINGTNIDVVANGGIFGSLCAGPESGNCVDMGGSGGNALGNIELATPLNLTAGVYDLSFDLVGSGRGQNSSTTVDFGSYTQTFLLTSGDITDGIVNVAVSIAGGPTQLEFINNGVAGGNPNVGALLDNVSITTGASPVPEPGTLGLMLTGLLGAAGAVRRRFSA
jgi:hypothetical protein